MCLLKMMNNLMLKMNCFNFILIGNIIFKKEIFVYYYFLLLFVIFFFKKYFEVEFIKF